MGEIKSFDDYYETTVNCGGFPFPKDIARSAWNAAITASLNTTNKTKDFDEYVHESDMEMVRAQNEAKNVIEMVIESRLV